MFLNELGYASLMDIAQQSADVKEPNEYKKYLDVIYNTLKKLISYHDYLLTSMIVSAGNWKEIPEKTITICRI